jgi:hypothetical protein
MTNYQLGKIYKIVCNTTGLTYYGSTCEPTLARRLVAHRSSYQHWKSTKKGYVTSFKVMKNKNYDIVLVELVPSDNKMELHKRERFYFENNECVNKNLPISNEFELSAEGVAQYMIQYRVENIEKITQLKADYYANNREKISISSALSYSENREKIKASSSLYYSENREKIAARDTQYRFENKEKIAAKNALYRAENKEKIAVRDALYRAENKEKIAARKAESYKNKMRL